MTKVDSGWNINFLASASSRGKNISLGEVSNVLVMNKEQEPAIITKARNIDLGTALRLKNFLLPNSADKEIFSFQTTLEGKLKSLTSAYRFNRNKANDYLVRTTFNNLSSRGDPNVPAFSGLSGEAEIFPNGADLTFVCSSLDIMKHP